ncbi:MAG: FctA domain-containing protein, partial [Atopobiaceae bacterium]|nr:FctA domain-containing protein [Atopobiaceae bacterium]
HGKEAFMFRLSRFVDEAAEEDESYEQGDVLPDNDTVTIKAGETGAFGKITYTQPGDYFYAINEVAPQSKTDGMAYDTSTYLVLVSVDDDLNASDPVYAKYVGDETFDTLYEALDSGDKTAAKLVVTNIYKKKTTNDDTTKQDDKTTNESNKTHTPSTTTTTTTTPTTATTAAHTSSSAPTVQTTTATRTTTAKTSDPTSFAMAAVLAVIGLLAVAAGRRRAKQLA